MFRNIEYFRRFAGITYRNKEGRKIKLGEKIQDGSSRFVVWCIVYHFYEIMIIINIITK